MMDMDIFRQLDFTLTQSINSTQKIINESLGNENLSDEDREKLKKAQRMNIKSKKDLENYKKQMKDDFNI